MVYQSFYLFYIGAVYSSGTQGGVEEITGVWEIEGGEHVKGRGLEWEGGEIWGRGIAGGYYVWIKRIAWMIRERVMKGIETLGDKEELLRTVLKVEMC